MSDELFEVVFRGDVVAGQPVAEVKQRLVQLFNADAARIDQMFFGRPVVVKRNLDRETAERYQSSLLKAGALVDIRKTAEVEHTTSEILGTETSSAEPEASAVQATPPQVPKNIDFGVAPVGADVLSPSEQKEFKPVEVDTSELSVADAGADILADEDKKEFVAQDVDTSSLTVDKPE